MPPLDRFCPRCGAACSSSALLCPSCGSSLKATVPLASTSPLRTVTDHLAPNQVLKERYLILSQVGLGGFGAVYKAQDMGHNNRLVAIKEIGLRGLTPQQAIEATGSFNREVSCSRT
jgi:eukaryotic-like serine/threonine-protein kinase